MEKKAYQDVKVDRPYWDKDDAPLTKDSVDLKIPEHLQCQVCRDLLKDAIMMPECACTMCDECARESLLSQENTKNECPLCSEPNNSPDDLIPSRKDREAVTKFKNSTGVAHKTFEQKTQKLELPEVPGITTGDTFDAVVKDQPASPDPSPKVTPKIETETPEPKDSPKETQDTPTHTPSPKGSPKAEEVKEKVERKVDTTVPPPGYTKPAIATSKNYNLMHI